MEPVTAHPITAQEELSLAEQPTNVKSKQQILWEKHWCLASKPFLAQLHTRSHNILSLISPPTAIPDPDTLTAHAIATIWKSFLHWGLNPRMTTPEDWIIEAAELAYSYKLPKSSAYDRLDKREKESETTMKQLKKSGCKYDFDRFVDLVLAAPRHLQPYICGEWISLASFSTEKRFREDQPDRAAWVEISSGDVVLIDERFNADGTIKREERRVTMDVLIHAILVGEDIFDDDEGIQELRNEQAWQMFVSGAIWIHRRHRMTFLGRSVSTSESALNVPTRTGRRWLRTKTPEYYLHCQAHRQIASFLYRHPQLIPASCWSNIPSLCKSLKQLTKGISNDPGSPPWYTIASPYKPEICTCSHSHEQDWSLIPYVNTSSTISFPPPFSTNEWNARPPFFDLDWSYRNVWHYGPTPPIWCCSWCCPFDNVYAEYERMREKIAKGKLTKRQDFVGSETAFWQFEGDGRGLRRREENERIKRKEERRRGRGRDKVGNKDRQGVGLLDGEKLCFWVPKTRDSDTDCEC